MKRLSDMKKMAAILTAVAVILIGAFIWTGCGLNPAAPNVNATALQKLQFVEDTFGDLFAPRDSSRAGLGSLAAGSKDKKDKDDESDETTKFRLESDTDAVLIKNGGGTIKLQLTDGHSKLFVPKGAVADRVEISASMVQVDTPWGVVTMYDFHPDGLVFEKPATLTLHLKGSRKGVPDGTVMELRWFNPATGEWEFQEASKVWKNKVTFSIHHFSKYGIS